MQHDCTYCGSKLHPTSHCPHTWGGSCNRTHLRCSYCGQTDHNYDACTKRAGGVNKNAVRLADKGLYYTDR